MIVLDEQLLHKGLEVNITKWYRGSVKSIIDLRPNTLIKDDNIPRLLRRQSDATFVTINVKDFWQDIAPDFRFCVICFDLPDSRAYEIPKALREVFHHPMFNSKAKRMGKIIRVVKGQISFYSVEERITQTLPRIIREEEEIYEV